MNSHYIKESFKALLIASLSWALLSLSESEAHTFQTNLYPDIELKEDKLVIELWIATFLFPPQAASDFHLGHQPDPTLAQARGL